MAASEFKAKCLSVLDEVAATGEPVTILKRGKPVAQLVPSVPRGKKYPQHEILGTVRIVSDILDPVLPPGDWEAERGKR
ncbi:MAG: type II toxin-antitoxin system Phd/YefM family antitoxin [Vicinamibacteria bacterium]